MSPRQRRGALVLALAVLGAVVTFVAVLRYTQQVEARLGPLRPVVVAARDVPPFTPLLADDLEVVEMPRVYVPDVALSSAAAGVGRVSPLPLTAGMWVQSGQLTDPPALRPGERAVTLAADGEMSLARSLRAGDAVDVVAAYERGDEPPRSVVEIAGARVLAVSYPADGDVSWVTLAVTEDETLALVRVRASADAVFVGQVPDAEVPR